MITLPATWLPSRCHADRQGLATITAPKKFVGTFGTRLQMSTDLLRIAQRGRRCIMRRLLISLSPLVIVAALAACASPPPPAPAPAAAPPPPPKSYLVFFDWNKADLSDRAKQIIKEA